MTEEEFTSITPSSNEVPPDPESPEDPGNLQSSEDLDEDRLDADPLEEGVEPPEQWSPASARGVTPSVEHEGETLDERLAEERADFADSNADADEERPLAATPIDELDGSIDERAEEVTGRQPDQTLEGGSPEGPDREEHTG